MNQREYLERAGALEKTLYRTAWVYLGSESQAVDAVDEAVYRGLCACGKLRQPEYFSTWLTRILLNVCAGEARRRRREVAMEALPETAAAQEYDALPLKEAIAALPENLRAVVTLRYFTGLTLEETARALDVPVGTVSTRQRRALELLRLELGEEEEP